MQIIAIEQALNLPCSLFIDTRSPAEFEQGHIPGAINVPLLENDERAIVGTLYKQIGPESAKIKGLEIVSGKLALMVGQIADLLKSRPQATLVVYCWRGGMRSKSLLIFIAATMNRKSMATGWCSARIFRHSSSISTSRWSSVRRR